MAEKHSPILTIGTLCWNHRPFVEQCLDSIRQAQGSEAFQVVVVDNASTDGSADFIAKYLAANRLGWELVRTENNLGAPAGWNVALERAHGKYFVAASTDDFFHPMRFAAQIQRLEQCSQSVLMAGGAVQSVDSFGKPNGGLREFTACTEPTSALSLKLSGQAPISASSQMWRTEFLRSVGGFDERFHTEDVPIEWKAAAVPGAQFVYVAESHTFYRRHEGNSSASLSSDLSSQMYRQLADELDLPRDARAHLARIADRRGQSAHYEDVLIALADGVFGARLRALRSLLTHNLATRSRLNLVYLALSPMGRRRARRRYRRFVRPEPPSI